MSLRIAFIEAAPEMRIRVAGILTAAFPRIEINSFMPPGQLPNQSFDWSAFDAIVVGQLAKDDDLLPFVRNLALNPTRRPVVYLCCNGPDTTTSATLKLLAVVKLSWEEFRDQDLVSAIVFARRDRGFLAPVAPGPSATSPSWPNLQEIDVHPPPSPHILLVDGSAGFRRVIANYLMSAWPSATVEEIDPFAQTLHGGEFIAGVKGDIVLLSSIFTRHEALSILRRLRTKEGCPPLILAANRDLAPHAAELKTAGAAEVLLRDSLSRNSLCRAISRAMGLFDRPPAASTERPGNFNFLLDGERFNLEIDGFRSIAAIASTAMSQVFLAENLIDRSHAVIKILTATTHNDLPGIDIFCSRFRFLSGLNGRSVVRYIDAGVAGHWPYIALEHLSAGDLRSRMQALPSQQAKARILFKLAAALSTVHGGSFVHLDIKPEHILFRENGEIVLIDFNIATRFGGVARHRISGDVLGTPAYMSPEQGQGLPLDGRSDLYSVGVIFYEMLTGSLPYVAKSDAETIFRHIHDEIPLLPLPMRAFQPIIDGLMAKDRDDRIATGADLAFALQPFMIADPGERPG